MSENKTEILNEGWTNKTKREYEVLEDEIPCKWYKGDDADWPDDYLVMIEYGGSNYRSPFLARWDPDVDRHWLIGEQEIPLEDDERVVAWTVLPKPKIK